MFLFSIFHELKHHLIHKKICTGIPWFSEFPLYFDAYADTDWEKQSFINSGFEDCPDGGMHPLSEPVLLQVHCVWLPTMYLLIWISLLNYMNKVKLFSFMLEFVLYLKQSAAMACSP